MRAVKKFRVSIECSPTSGCTYRDEGAARLVVDLGAVGAGGLGLGRRSGDGRGERDESDEGGESHCDVLERGGFGAGENSVS